MEYKPGITKSVSWTFLSLKLVVKVSLTLRSWDECFGGYFQVWCNGGHSYISAWHGEIDVNRMVLAWDLIICALMGSLFVRFVGKSNKTKKICMCTNWLIPKYCFSLPLFSKSLVLPSAGAARSPNALLCSHGHSYLQVFYWVITSHFCLAVLCISLLTV